MATTELNAKTKTRHRSNAAGFTLVELMVVISIIAILATIVGVNIMGALDEANVGTAKAQIKSFESALVAYKLKYKRFPENLNELVNNQGGINFLSGKTIPKDPWDHEYIYTSKGSSAYTIVSYGGDGAPGGDKYDSDISSDDLGENK